jgi:hypothetical protein
MPDEKKPPSAIPSKVFPTTPTKTQEERAKEGIPPPKQPAGKSDPKRIGDGRR